MKRTIRLPAKTRVLTIGKDQVRLGEILHRELILKRLRPPPHAWRRRAWLLAKGLGAALLLAWLVVKLLLWGPPHAVRAREIDKYDLGPRI
jgi:hypothetical protein